MDECEALGAWSRKVADYSDKIMRNVKMIGAQSDLIRTDCAPSHAKWEFKYHFVFIPNCRRNTLYGD
jgi:hypothetical protein